MNLDRVVERVEQQWLAEFRRFVTTGKASEEFQKRFDKNPAWQEAAAAVLGALFSPFAEAIQKEKKGEGKRPTEEAARSAAEEALPRAEEKQPPWRTKQPVA